MGESIPGSDEELLKEQKDTKPDPDPRKKLSVTDLESRLEKTGDAPG